MSSFSQPVKVLLHLTAMIFKRQYKIIIPTQSIVMIKENLHHIRGDYKRPNILNLILTDLVNSLDDYTPAEVEPAPFVLNALYVIECITSL